MAGNEASEKLSWPWRKRGREKGGREREIRKEENNPIPSRRPRQRHALVLSRVGWQGREGGLKSDLCGRGGGPTERPNRSIVQSDGRRRDRRQVERYH